MLEELQFLYLDVCVSVRGGVRQVHGSGCAVEIKKFSKVEERDSIQN